MRSLTSETLARLRSYRDRGRAIPPELCDDAIECLRRVVDAGVIRAERDALVRQAAELLPEGLPPWRKAQALASEAAGMLRVWHVLSQRSPVQPFLTPRDALHAARLLAELPDSVRQYHRLLKSESRD